jgi:hypothetical protein
MNSKTIFRSKTFWLQLVAVAASFYPPVGVWVAANPVGALAALGAANVLVRFVSKGTVTLFPADDAGNVGSGNGLGGSLLRLLMITFTAAALVGLPSCSVSTAPDGTVTRKPDAESISLVQGLAAWAVGVWQYQEAVDAAEDARKDERRAAKVAVIPAK